MSSQWGPPEGDPYAGPSYSRSGQVQYPGGQPGYAGQLYSQPALAQPGYGPAGYNQGPRQETDSNAVVALVLSVMAWMLCPIVLAIAALVMAGNAQRDIDASQGMKSGDGLVKAARIISWINIGAYVAGGMLLLLFIGFIAAVDSSSYSTDF